MAKTKFKDFDDAKAQKASTKEELELSKGELKAFRKQHSIEKDAKPDTVKDKTIRGQYKTLTEGIEAKRALIEDATAFMGENKPKKEAKVRETKYNYPDNATADEKKKIRAAARAEAKRALKGDKKKEKAEKEPKAEKGADKKSDKKADKKEEGKKKKDKAED